MQITWSTAVPNHATLVALTNPNPSLVKAVAYTGQSPVACIYSLSQTASNRLHAFVVGKGSLSKHGYKSIATAKVAVLHALSYPCRN